MSHPQKVKLVAGLISGDAELLGKAKQILEKAFKNQADFESEAIDFVHTDYYKDEMGEDLKRKFLSFAKSVGLRDIYKIKLKTNLIERKLSRYGKRTINIDPGYLDLSKIVLLSTKDYSHRVYLDKGIFAEVALYYRDKSFNPWPWTYPDYKTRAYIDIFNSIREIHRQSLRRI